MSRQLQAIGWSGLCFLACLAAPAALAAQAVPPSEPLAATPTLLRTEGTDPEYGIHWVRLLLALPTAGDPGRAPRFTVECQDLNGKHDLLLFVSFGGFEDLGFVPPFQGGKNKLYGPQFPGVDLKMTFEGYRKSKPFTRSWAVLPGGEFRYRNAGADSPNMDSTRNFMSFLNALPALRIVHAKPAQGDPGELLFPTRPLLDELNKTPICSP